MASFTKAPDDILDRVERIKRRYHGDLTDAEVTIGVLMAHQPVKLHGYECAATVKITGLEQRGLLVEDAIIKIHAKGWEDLGEESRDALIDHELHHLEVKRDKDGDVVADDHGRPVLKMRLHDWNLGGFEVIAGRHGPAALEVQAFRAVNEEYHQQLFRWTDDSAPADEPSWGSAIVESIEENLKSVLPPRHTAPVELTPDPRAADERFECADCRHRRPCTDHPCPSCGSSLYRVVSVGGHTGFPVPPGTPLVPPEKAPRRRKRTATTEVVADATTGLLGAQDRIPGVKEGRS